MPAIVSVLFLALAGCGGEVAKSESSPSRAPVVDASTPQGGSPSNASGTATGSAIATGSATATGSAIATGSGSATATGSESDAAPISWSGRVPSLHRASATACPEGRPAGVPCWDGGVASPTDFACAQDSDCTAGVNGRCLAVPQLVGPSPPMNGTVEVTYCETQCSYDQCQSDSDCAAHTPCVCRFASLYGSPNLCSAASLCATDADCGPPGFCSPSFVAGQVEPAYFCHTSNDLCVDDTDCPSQGLSGQGSCAFDATMGLWRCTYPSPMR